MSPKLHNSPSPLGRHKYCQGLLGKAVWHFFEITESFGSLYLNVIIGNKRHCLSLLLSLSLSPVHPSPPFPLLSLSLPLSLKQSEENKRKIKGYWGPQDQAGLLESLLKTKGERELLVVATDSQTAGVFLHDLVSWNESVISKFGEERCNEVHISLGLSL